MVGLHFVSKSLLLFPFSAQEINGTRNCKAVCGKTVSKHEAVKIEAENDSKEPAEAYSEHYAVKQGEHEAEPCVADSLYKGVSSAHNCERGEHPHNCRDKGRGHIVNERVVGEYHKELLAYREVKDHTHKRKRTCVYPGKVDRFFRPALLLCRDILADHRECGVLYSLRYLIDDIVDSHSDAEGCRGYNAYIVYHRVNVKHREVDAARLDSHRRTELEYHSRVFLIGYKALRLEIEAKLHLTAVEIPYREDKGHRLTDYCRPRRTGNAHSEGTDEDDVEHEVDDRGDADEHKRTAVFSDNRLTELFTPVIYGSGAAAAFYQKRLNDYEPVKFVVVDSAERAQQGRVNLVECGAKELSVTPGKPSKAGGEAAAAALNMAIEELKDGAIDALVTAPIDKEMIQSETFSFTGHTEFLAKELEGEPLMIMTSELMRVGLATIHVPVAQVADSLSKELIVERINQINASMRQDFGVVRPKVAVLALNPHAGDGGLLGKEEQEIIKPAIVEAYENGVLAFGPFAADGFFASGQFKNYDAILAMYHDQGLAPFKTLTPNGVNFTASLSEVRTSPDHGVAYDIAGKGIADEQSMRNAIYEAIDIVQRRREWAEWNANPLQHFEREKGRDISIKDLPETEHHD